MNNTPSFASLEKTLDRVHHKYIRFRDCPDGIGHCISCGTPITPTTCDAGHYNPCQHHASRWDDQNVNAQCQKCNREHRANIPGYTKGLNRKYGPAVIDRLCQLKHSTLKYSRSELQEKIQYYNRKIKEVQ